VENIRRDVRVVNLSLIAVDWYIDQLRRKVNDSPAIKMTIPADKMYGKKRIKIPIDPTGRNKDKPMPLLSALKFVGEDHPIPLQNGNSLDSYMPTRNVYIDVNKQKAIANGIVPASDIDKMPDRLEFNIANKGETFVFKGDVALLDIIASNAFDRPIYFAVTCRPESLHGLDPFFELEGLALRFVPIRSPERKEYGMIGKGRVDHETFYNNVMNKFKWGNFDKEELYIDRSYLPSVQSHRLVMLRTCEDLLRKGDKKKAVEIAGKFFESFPNMNFRYDAQIVPMIRVFAAGGEKEKAKKHMEILATETLDHLEFYTSLDPEELQSGYLGDYSLAMRTKDDLIRLAQQMGDVELEKKYKDMFDIYKVPERIQG